MNITFQMKDHNTYDSLCRDLEHGYTKGRRSTVALFNEASAMRLRLLGDGRKVPKPKMKED